MAIDTDHNELKHIKLAVKALGATAHIALGLALAGFTDPMTNPAAALAGLAFILLGAIQKIIVIAEWNDLRWYDNLRKQK